MYVRMSITFKFVYDTTFGKHYDFTNANNSVLTPILLAQNSIIFRFTLRQCLTFRHLLLLFSQCLISPLRLHSTWQA